MKTRLQGVLESSPFPILLVSLVGIVLLTVFGPALVVGDTWLTLMAGREVSRTACPRPRRSRCSARARRGPTSSGSPRCSSTARTSSRGCEPSSCSTSCSSCSRSGSDGGRCPGGRGVVSVDVRRRPPRRARRTVGLDDPRPDGRAAALRRGALAAARRRAPWCAAPDAPRAPRARPLGEPPRLGRPRRGPDGAPRRLRARARASIRLAAGRAPRARTALRPRDAVRLGHRRLLRPDARRRPVRGDPARVAVVEPERDHLSLLRPGARRRRARRGPALPAPARTSSSCSCSASRSSAPSRPCAA